MCRTKLLKVNHLFHEIVPNCFSLDDKKGICLKK
jgi:hypothetical protein